MEWLVHQQQVILEDEIGYNTTFLKGSAKIPLLKKVEQNSTFEKSGAKLVSKLNNTNFSFYPWSVVLWNQ